MWFWITRWHFFPSPLSKFDASCALPHRTSYCKSSRSPPPRLLSPVLGKQGGTLVSVVKLAACDRILNEWFKVSSEQLSQLINLLMAVHVWKEAGDSGGPSSVASPFQAKTAVSVAVTPGWKSSNGANARLILRKAVGSAGFALFSLITFKHPQSIWARMWPSILFKIWVEERKWNGGLKHFSFNPAWFLVMIHLVSPWKCFKPVITEALSPILRKTHYPWDS